MFVKIIDDTAGSKAIFEGRTVLHRICKDKESDALERIGTFLPEKLCYEVNIDGKLVLTSGCRIYITNENGRTIDSITPK